MKTIWICVGTNPDATTPTWFLPFDTAEEGQSVIDAVPEISWELYPCDPLTAPGAIEMLRWAVNDHHCGESCNHQGV